MSIQNEPPMLAPQAIRVFEVAGVPFLLRPREIPLLGGVLYLMIRLTEIAYPRLPAPLRWLLGMIWFITFYACDTLHNIGHIFSSRAVNAPVNAVYFFLGLQVTVYYEETVTPVQHVGRAAGGILTSALLTLEGNLIYRIAKRIPILRTLARTWYLTNGLYLLVSALPTPSFDGSVILNQLATAITGEEGLGAEVVQTVGLAASGAFLLVGMVSLLKGRVLWGLGLFGAGVYGIADTLLLRGRRPLS
ncbi:MAG TPA: hypothetical protein PLD47_00135 [Aggregatilineales bacterium]|nr:hypothetical protein [Anaerolineales bacterium]HRE46106.1 hypothetical protein [Aggregatilineales bacterium]